MIRSMTASPATMISARSALKPGVLDRARGAIFRKRSSKWLTSARDTKYPLTGRPVWFFWPIIMEASVVNVPPEPIST